MKKRWISPTLAAVALLVTVAPARLVAAEPYLGGALGTKVPESNAGAQFERLTHNGPDASWKLYGGVSLGRHFGVEGGYYDFGQRSCCRELFDAGFSSRVDGLALAGVGRWPASERVELFGKAGVLRWHESGDSESIAGPHPFSSDGSDLLWGVGVTLRLVERLRGRVEWEGFELGDSSADALWLSLELHF